jgi:tetratricopeptide (TPR) repeat protein
MLIRNHPRFWKREICQELIESAHAARFSSMQLMRHRSWLAVLVATQIQPKRGSDEVQVTDLRARAWLGYANALRVSGDFNAADQAFLNAQTHMKTGGGTLPLRARVLKQLGSLRLDQRRFGESRPLIREATEIWRDLHDRQEVARCLVLEANAASEEGDPGAALRLLDQSERIADSTADPKLGLIIAHNRTRYLAENLQVGAAVDLHDQVSAQFAPTIEPLLHIRLTWTKGQLLCWGGHFEPAIEALSSAQQDFLAQGNRCDAAMVSIELASVLGRVGRRHEMRMLAAAAFQEMTARRITREALAALILLRKSA